MKMMKYNLRSCLSFIALLFISCIANAQIQINSHVLPPYLNRIADYASRPELMVVTVTNTSTVSLEIQLTAKLSSDNGLSAWVKPGFRSPRAVLVQAGQTISLNGNEIANLFDINNIEYTGISRQDMVRGLGLKEGTYQLCIQALDYRTLRPLSPEQPMGCTQLRITDLEPPRILTPMDQQIVDNKGIQALSITWSTPPASSPLIQYKLKLVEMPINRNANDAIQTTTPLYQETLNSNMLLYGPAHPALIKGRSYALAVQAVDPTGLSNFRNQGLSQVIQFVYGNGQLQSPIILTPENKSTFKGESELSVKWKPDQDVNPNTLYTVNFYEVSRASNANLRQKESLFYSKEIVGTNVLNYDFVQMPTLERGKTYQVEVIAKDPTQQQQYVNNGKSNRVEFLFNAKTVKDTTHIKGRLVYQFKDDPTGKLYPIANEKVYVSKVYAVTNTDSMNISRVEELGSFLSGYLNSEEVVDGMYVKTDKDGNFSLPLYLNPLDTSGIIADENLEKHLSPSTGSRSNSARHYLQQMKGRLGVYYKVNVMNPHFKKNSSLIKFVSRTENDLQEIILDANAYALKVNVREVFNTIKGDYVEGATIKIYRELNDKTKAAYQIPKYEGDIHDDNQYNKAIQNTKILIAQRITPKLTDKKNSNEAYVEFNSLFKNLNGDAYNYKIALVNGNTVLKEASFNTVAQLVNAGVSTGANFNLNTSIAGAKIDFNTNAISQALTLQNGVSTSSTSSTAARTIVPATNTSRTITNNTAAQSSISLDQSKQLNSNPALTIAAEESPYIMKDKWQDYRFNEKIDVAYLTLEKELITAPRTKITGKLRYSYKNKNNIPAQSYANMPVKLMVFYEYYEQKKTSNSSSNSSSSSGTTLMQYYPNLFQGLASAGYSHLVSYNVAESYSKINIGSNAVSDNYKVLQTVTTDSEGNFEFDFPNTDLVGNFSQGRSQMHTGDQAHIVEGQFRRVFKLVPDVPFYCAPDDPIIVQPWESKDIGTLTSFVKTFNVKVNVTKVNKEVNPTSATVFSGGVPINFYYDVNPKDYNYLPKLPGVDINERVNINATIPFSGNNNSSALTSSTNSSSSTSSSGVKFVYTPNIGATFTGMQLTNGVASISNNLNSSIAAMYSHVLIRQGETNLQTGVVEFRDVVRPYYIEGVGSSLNMLLEADGSGRNNNVAFYTDYFDSKSHVFTNRKIGNEVGALDISKFGYSIVFNKDFDPNSTEVIDFRLVPKPTVIRGRVIDKYTTLGLKNVYVRARILMAGEGKHPNNLIPDYAITDDNGYYEFTSLSASLKNYTRASQLTQTTQDSSYVEVYSAPGYKHQLLKMGSPSAGLSGEQIVHNFILDPLGRNAYGYVMDAESNKAVTARVKLKVNGTWVDTEGAHTKEGLNLTVPLVATQFAVTNFNNVVQQSVSQPNTTISMGTASSIVTRVGATGVRNTTLTIGNTQDASNPILAASANASSSNANPLTIVNNTGTVASGVQNASIATQLPVTLLTFPYQKFTMDLPARADSIIIMPYDPAYLTLVAAVNPKGANEFLGDFKLKKRKHLITVRVKTKDNKLVKNAKVYIEGAGEDYVLTNNHGEAKFEFVNNSTSNFNIYVTNKTKPVVSSSRSRVQDSNGIAGGIGGLASDIAFMPTGLNNFKSKDDLQIRVAEISVDKASLLTGVVKFQGNKKPVSNAKIYVNQGSSGNSESETYTNASGEYALYIPEGRERVNPLINVIATYAQAHKTFVGETKKLTITSSSKDQKLDFLIREIEGVDISKLYGFDVLLTNVREVSNNYIISGELIDFVDNKNFQGNNFGESSKSLTFSNVTVKKSTLLNVDNIPVAVATTNDVNLVERSVRIKAFDKYTAQLSNFNQAITLSRSSSDSTGIIRGKVRLIDNSFNFPTSYLTISSTDFYLGKYANTSANKQELDVFKSHDQAFDSKYSISKDKGEAINFVYLGFDGVSETKGARESYIQGDSINLYLNLKPIIQGGTTLTLETGKAVILNDQILPIKGEGGVEFALEKWKVSAKSWSLAPNSGGIVLKESKIMTGKADFNLKKLTIIPGELIFDAKEDISKDLTVGGVANIPLLMEKNSEVKFVFDPDVGNIPGKGRFKFTIKNPGNVAATIQNLPGMTKKGDRIEISYLSILSNLEEIFGFSQSQKPITIQSQLSFIPSSFYSNESGLLMNGSIALHLPKFKDNINSSISYVGKEKTLKIERLDFQFIGDGGTKFKTLSKEGAQFFSGRGYGIAGEITIPGSNNVLKANLVSMVTSSLSTAGSQVAASIKGVAQQAAQQAVQVAKDEAKSFAEQVVSAAADEIKKQAEVVIGNYRDQAEQYAADLLDQIANNESAKAAREFIENGLKTANDTYNEVLKIGETGEQFYNDVTAKMRLAGEGLDAVNSIIDGNPIGGMLQLNGVLKGALGIDVKDMAKQKAKQVAMQAIKAIQEELPVDNIASGVSGAGGFSGGKFDFDLKTGRIFGALSMPILTTGAVTLKNIELEMLFERAGWYFFAGAKVIAPVPIIFPLDVGMAVGSHGTVTPQMEAKFTSQAYVKKLPSAYKKNGFHGFFITGRKDIIPETSFGFDAGIASLKVGFGAGFDARVYGSFGGDMEFGVGAMVFAHAYASLSVLGGVCSVSGNADAEVGVKAVFKITEKNPSFEVKGCFSANIAAKVGCLMITKEFGIGVKGNLTLCAGNCNKGVDFVFSSEGGKCSSDPAFDY